MGSCLGGWWPPKHRSRRDLPTDQANPATTVTAHVGTATAKSVTVFPIVLNSGAPIPGVSADMSKNMAELIGLMLERGGIKEIEIADAKFIPPEKADLAKAAEAFGQFVKSQKLKTEYALFGQFFGTPGKGADEIRLAVVDRQGKVVLTDRLDRQQLLARGATKVDPMLACSYAVDQLRAFWGLTNPSEKMPRKARWLSSGPRSPGCHRRLNGKQCSPV